ncbi:hypothetical protein [Rubrimonas cliftonensis]|uniref:Uncharacterized protein n=1 Tax=Rubrimonas cliftonensis TaxID=89524 RepID=A0A1H4ETU9_9RHOB|nr:hypothetical protein [Rubrimonas cliftonensis]SEA87642.1 hypothetical protein SAMN05444370_11562 [Rubrimonas cliftonensis]
MSEDRKSLDFGVLEEFKPRAPSREPDRAAVDRAAAFPSREPADDAQMNIRASKVEIERFKAMAKAERYRHGEFLVILMDAYERSAAR